MPRVNLTQVEDQLIAKLQPLANEKVRVVAYPDAFNTSNKPHLGNMVVINASNVSYQQPEFAPNIGCKPLQQQINVGIDLVLMSKNLRFRGHAIPGLPQEPISIHYMLERIADLVTGCRLDPEWGPVYCLNSSSAGRNDSGYFIFDLQLGFQAIQETRVDLLEGFEPGDQIS